MDEHDREADTIAGIRTFILVAYMVTNIAIVANAVRHWDDVKSVTHPVVQCLICYNTKVTKRKG